MKAIDMQSRIELELRGKEAATIKELNLDNCRSTQIEGLNDDFANLEMLSLINVGLTTLKGFPSLPSLRKLELSDNRISNGLNNLLACTNLTHLNLSGNKIKDMEVLGPLAKFEKLSNLDLFNCEITTADSYRIDIFKLLPNLKYLDGFDKNDQEDDEEYDGNEEDDDDEEDEDDDEEGDDDEDDEDEDEDDEEDEQVGDDKDWVVVKAPAKGEAVDEAAAAVVDGDDDEEDDDEDDDEDEDENEVGLSYLQKSNLGDDEDDADFDEKKALAKAEEDDDEDEDEDEEIEPDEVDAADAVEGAAGGRLKRKLDETEDAE